MSGTSGYVIAQGVDLSGADKLTDALQAMLAGVTGLPGHLVRPRWQPTPASLPAVTINWAAIGVVSLSPDAYSYQSYSSAGQAGGGVQHQERHQGVEALASFYGPAAMAYANMLTMGLLIAQNREGIAMQGLRLVTCGPPRHVPELTNFQFIDHVDVEISLRQILFADYALSQVLPPSSVPLTNNI